MVTEEEVVYNSLFYAYIIYGLVGVLSAYTYLWTWVNLPPDATTVEVLGMILPANLIFVLIPCHLILTPWTFTQAYGAKNEAEWFVPNEIWFTLIAFGMSFVENMYRGPYTPLVLCICLFDWLVDVMAGITYKMNMEAKSGAYTLVNAPMAIIWSLYGLARQPLDPFLAGVSIIMGSGNAFLIYRGVTGDESASYALFLMRLVDSAIFLWSYLAMMDVQSLVSFLLSIGAVLVTAKFE